MRWYIVMILTGLIMSQGMLVFASGKKDEQMRTVDRLIEQRHFNDAILILSDILRRDPEQLDEVEKYMDRIRKARNQYNEVYENLIEKYESGQLEDAYPIIKELEELDKNPNKAAAESLIVAKNIAAVRYYNKLWLEIMEKAAAEIEQGRYWDAVATYETGFSLAREVFDEAGYGKLHVTSVDRETASLRDSVAGFMAMDEEFSSALERERASFDIDDSKSILNSVGGMAEYLAEIAKLEKRFTEYALFFERENKAIQGSQGNSIEVLHLSYLNRLILGRQKVEKKEGIAGVLDIVFGNETSFIMENTVPLSYLQYDKALAFYDSGITGEAEQAFADASRLAESALKAVALKTSKIYVEDDFSIGKNGMDIVKELFCSYFSLFI